MRYEDENIWLTQKMLATLYDVDVRTINEHMKKIYSDNELEQESTIRNFRIVQNEGSRIRAAALEATEKISWQMPTFWQGENLIHFAAFKKHIGLYPGGEATSEFSGRLTGYKTSKGAIQLPFGKPIDY
jgi:uncharacterized protein YdhG (YjbR/CyaY superfamily)